MAWPFELTVGWAFLRAIRGGRSDRGGRFVSFIAVMSMLGIALGVAALVIVMSVMNGFQREVRARMLAVVPHVEVWSTNAAAVSDWPATIERLRAQPGVAAVAPAFDLAALVGRGDQLRGAQVLGIEPAAQAGVSPLAARLAPSLAGLRAGERQIVLGATLAREIGAKDGDAVALALPPAGGASGMPRLVGMTVLAVFESGHHEFDSSLAYTHVADAIALAGATQANLVQLRLQAHEQAPALAIALRESLGPGVAVQDWTARNRSWFEAVQLQKRMFALILVLIVAVAAFNLVSTLVMTVTDKRGQIAILRTLGASPRSVMAIFLCQGAASGLIGTAAGLVLGLGVAANIETWLPRFEDWAGVHFLDASVYLIKTLPSEPRAADVVPIAFASLALSFLATLYPSWQAARLQPAQALHQA